MQILGIIMIGLGLAVELGAVVLASKTKENLDLRIIGAGIALICFGLILYTISFGGVLTQPKR